MLVPAQDLGAQSRASLAAQPVETQRNGPG